jgi:transcriptional regulator with XRE-family HTH domain
MGEKRKKLSFTNQIRQAVDDADETRYRIAKNTGMSQSMMSRFMTGDRGLSMKALDGLAEYLGLEITKRKKRRQRIHGAPQTIDER